MKNTLKTVVFLLGMLCVTNLNTKAQSITRVDLINAATDQVIKELSLSEANEINLDDYPSLNCRAVTDPEPLGNGQKVAFELTTPSGAKYNHSEGGAPYALFGDMSGDYKPWEQGFDNPPAKTAGDYTLKVTPGTGGAVTYNLTLISSEGNEGGGQEPPTPPVSITAPLNLTSSNIEVVGEKKQWHDVVLKIEGPSAKETDEVNPFLAYKLTAEFTQGDLSYKVPGYFAADGDAANTSALQGNIWKVHFRPPTTGNWNYKLHFRIGDNVAINDNVDAGFEVTPLNGSTGSFAIVASDKTGKDLRGKGRLEYVNKRYLQFAGNKEWFLKAGPDAPENLLAYEDFDNTPDHKNYRKSWSDHLTDYNEGDVTWANGKGKEIIGVVNYLSNKGMNILPFLTFNTKGDDRNVFPYVKDSNFGVFDCSKLDQWEKLFTHAESKGMYLHFKLQEVENECLLDNGNTTFHRKLYYRELIARFGHHLALNWNLGEENQASFNEGKRSLQNDTQRKAMAQYFFDNDPYKNHIVIHTAPNDQEKIYTPMLGNKSKLTGVSIQTNYNKVHEEVSKWVTKSENSGKIWVVSNDEQGNAKIGVPHDDYNNSSSPGAKNKHDIRKLTLWGSYMAGGAGVEYYFGYEIPNSDLTCQTYRTRNDSWDYCRHAMNFFNQYLPFWEMKSTDNLTSKGYCFSKAGQVYAVYLPAGGSANVTLADGSYNLQWYNPREGGELRDATKVQGGTQSISAPDANDWVAYITNEQFAHTPNRSQIEELAMNPYEPPVDEKEESVEFIDFPKEFNGSASSFQFKVKYYAKEARDLNIELKDETYITSVKKNVQAGENTVTMTVNVPHKLVDGPYRFILSIRPVNGNWQTNIAQTEKKITISSGPSSSCNFTMASFTDFPNFDLDNYKPAYKDNNKQCLAINASQYKGEFAAAEAEFRGTKGNYDVKLNTLCEFDGESTYKVYADGKLIGEFQNPRVPEADDYKPASKTFENVAIEEGATIKVEFNSHTNGLIPENGGTAYSRGRWKSVEFSKLDCDDTPPGLTDDPCPGSTAPFEEKDGYLIIEPERIANFAEKGFTLHSDVVEGTNPLGSGYLRYSGKDNMGSSNADNTLQIPIYINNPGTYRFVWRNARDPQAETYDAGNDSWLLIEGEGARFYGLKGSTQHNLVHHTKIWVQKNPFVYECSGETHVNGEKVNNMSMWVEFTDAGEYTIEYGGRSAGHCVDRIVLYQEDKVAIATNTTTPESARKGCETIVDPNPDPDPTTGLTEDPCPEATGAFEEKDGYLIIEPERIPNFEDKGFTLHTNEVEGTTPLGSGYLRYSSNNNMGDYNAQKVLQIPIHINTPGVYQFTWRNARDPQAETFDAGNDSWLLIHGEGARFFGVKGSTEYTLTHHTKIWVQKDPFVYKCSGETHVNGAKVNGMSIWVEFSEAGDYTIDYGGRSAGHCVDRIVLFQADRATIAKDLSTPESLRTDCTATPVNHFEKSEEKVVKIYPNPFKEVCKLSTTKAINTVEFFAISGEKVEMKQCICDEASIPTSNWKPGYYLARFLFEDGTQEVQKLYKK